VSDKINAPERTDAQPRIAILVDSCCDVPSTYLQSHPFYVVPLTINYHDTSYLDGVEITPAEVYARFEEEIPSTSTPTPAHAHEVFERIAADGFTHVVCITISSGLSATFQVLEDTGAEFAHLKVEMVDTLNIGIGSGMTAMYAADLLDQGASFEEIVRGARGVVPRTRIFFVPDTLEYLYKGGRIGKAVYSLGTMLNLRPVITCSEEGKYVVCGKARGRKKSVAKAIELAQECITPGKRYRFAVAQGMAEEEARKILADAPAYFPDAQQIVDAKELSPVLVVHTGPGLIGFVLQTLDE
jgi:DegV family protein with EDD domain